MRIANEYRRALAALLVFLFISTVRCQAPESGSRCLLSDEEKVSIKDSETWRITSRVYQDYGIQRIVDCAEEGDVISFDSALRIRPYQRIVIRRNVTVDGSLSLEADRPPDRTVFTCPHGEGLFLIRQASGAVYELIKWRCVVRDCSFTLRNVAIRDCRLTKWHEVAGIIETDECMRLSTADYKVVLSDVAFERNENLGGSVGLFVRDPSCQRVTEFKNVAFESNWYRDASRLSTKNALNNVHVLENENAEGSGKTSFFHFPQNSSSIVMKMVAEKNKNAHVMSVTHGQLVILSSVFARNVGHGNEIVRVFSSSVTLENSRFLNNTCTCDGVAVAADHVSEAKFLSCDFSGNVANGYEGGAIYVVQPLKISFTFCNFTENVVEGSGGGTVVVAGSVSHPTRDIRETTESVEFSHCRFVGNIASYVTCVHFRQLRSQMILFDSCLVQNNAAPRVHGNLADFSFSAITLHESYVEDFATKNCRFEANSLARSVMWFSGATGAIRIFNSSFLDNSAPHEWGGTALYFLSDEVDGGIPERNDQQNETRFIIQGSLFERNDGGYNGAAVDVTGERVQVEMLDSRFLNNTGDLGAAVSVRNTASLYVRHCTFRDNTVAKGNGGAMRIEKTRAVIWNSTFVRNKSAYGGAIESATGVRVSHSKFSANEARLGGGALNVHCEEKAEHAERCAVWIRSSEFDGNQAGQSGGGLRVSRNYRLRVDGCRFRGNNATFGGGLSFFRAVQRGVWSIGNTTFSENNASTGGAMFVADGLIPGGAPTEDGAPSLESTDGDFALTDRTRPTLFLDNSVVSNNTAWISGGGLYVENVPFLQVDGATMEAPGTKLDCRGEERPSPHGQFRQSFFDNTIAGRYEENVASVSTGFCVTLFAKGQKIGAIAEGEKYTLRRWKSGDRFPTLHVVMYDPFGNNFSRTRSDRTYAKTSGERPEAVYERDVNAVLSSKIAEGYRDPFIHNRVYQSITTGSGNISLGNPYARPGDYQMRLRVEGFDKVPVTIEVQVRGCTINEESAQDDHFCKSCNSNQYNFRNDRWNDACLPCPENANCATRFTLPRAGYWNSFPCSPHMDRCIYKEACEMKEVDAVENRLDAERPCEQSNDSVEQYQSSQCAEEYTGVLCGSCKETAGRLSAFSCATCISRKIAAIALIGIEAVQLLLVLLSVRETLGAGTGHTDGRSPFWKTTRTARRASDLQARHDYSAPNSSESGAEMLVSVDSAFIGTFDSRSYEERAARRRFLGTLKIAINFLQTVSIAASMDVSWSVPAFILFETWDSMGSAITIGAPFVLDCLLPIGTQIPRTILRQMIIVLLPQMMALCISALAFLKELCSEKDWGRLLRRIILVYIVVTYNAYPSLVKVAVDAFNCVHVHDGADVEAAATTQLYWASDTSVQCYSDSHQAIVFAVSIPLALFLVTFPALLAAFLAVSAQRGNLSSAWTQETMGFLFVVFEDKYVCWDCLIFLRKACLSVIVVFSYSLGGNLQGLLCMTCLVIALFLQMHCNPFKRELRGLNSLEGVSLVVSFLTFLCGVVLNDGRLTSGVSKGIVTVLLFCSNIGLFAFLFITLCRLKFARTTSRER